jgi:hypothetical protein
MVVVLTLPVHARAPGGVVDAGCARSVGACPVVAQRTGDPGEVGIPGRHAEFRGDLVLSAKVTYNNCSKSSPVVTELTG